MAQSIDPDLWGTITADPESAASAIGYAETRADRTHGDDRGSAWRTEAARLYTHAAQLIADDANGRPPSADALTALTQTSLLPFGTHVALTIGGRHRGGRVVEPRQWSLGGDVRAPGYSSAGQVTVKWTGATVTAGIPVSELAVLSSATN
ncbi:hypothetical protein [Nocardia fluminea]|uniref:hypothetical protein n=1 Tax=Nocardia fluminea TaxID=134984 RepID=UPI003666CD5A